jgi:hypothetical protein
VAFVEKPDWRAAYLQMAETAWRNVDASNDPEFKSAWRRIAEDWEFLALLESERCPCGCPAIGMKRLSNGRCVPYCGKHLSQAIRRRHAREGWPATAELGAASRFFLQGPRLLGGLAASPN